MTGPSLRPSAMSKPKTISKPLLCRLCAESVPKNETFAHIQKMHKVKHPESVMSYYHGGALEELRGIMKRMARNRR